MATKNSQLNKTALGAWECLSTASRPGRTLATVVLPPKPNISLEGGLPTAQQLLPEPLHETRQSRTSMAMCLLNAIEAGKPKRTKRCFCRNGTVIRSRVHVLIKASTTSESMSGKMVGPRLRGLALVGHRRLCPNS